MDKEKQLELLDDTKHWIKILFLEDVEKDIMDKRCALDIEHYYNSVIFSATHTKEIVEKLQTLRDEIAKQIRDEKMEKIISEAETTKMGE